MQIIMEEDKVYFLPGQIVKLKQDIPNSPEMIVMRKETNVFNHDNKGKLKGIRCRWFTADGQLQEAVWSTKDLILI